MQEMKHYILHLIYVDEVCGLFKLVGLPGDEVKKKVFPLSLGGGNIDLSLPQVIAILSPSRGQKLYIYNSDDDELNA